MEGDDEAPKSAVELAMERLRRKDKDAGITETPTTEAQREAIAEARRTAEARLAEREILHRSQKARVTDADQAETLDLQYRRDRERITNDLDRKLEEIRKG